MAGGGKAPRDVEAECIFLVSEVGRSPLAAVEPIFKHRLRQQNCRASSCQSQEQFLILGHRKTLIPTASGPELFSPQKTLSGHSYPDRLPSKQQHRSQIRNNL